MLRHRARHAREEVAREIGRGVVRAVGQRVAAVEEAPQRVVDLHALVDAEAHAGVVHLAPLLVDLLALVVAEGREEVIEVGIRLRRAVLPVELHAVAQQPAGVARGCGVVIADEQQMHR